MKRFYVKKILVTLVIIFFSFEATYAASYCEGYNRGYKNGFEEAIGVPGFDPFVPICPPHPISEYDNPDHEYQVGYKKGHQDGYKKGDQSSDQKGKKKGNE